jgi:hypothetical protein
LPLIFALSLPLDGNCGRESRSRGRFAAQALQAWRRGP